MRTTRQPGVQRPGVRLPGVRLPGVRLPGVRLPGVRKPSVRRLSVRRSTVHGRGVFALVDFAADEHVVEYLGEIISWDEAQSRYQHAEQSAGHTFFFDRGDGSVIDGGSGGNSARWINHGCEPNCETIDEDGRILVHAIRAIRPGDELLIDYRLSVDDDADPAAELLYACRCGAASCRGTMLAP